MGLATLPCATIWMNAGMLDLTSTWNEHLHSCDTESILLAIKIDPAVARFSGQFLQVGVLMLPFNFTSALLTKFLQVQVRACWHTVCGHVA